MTISGYDSWLEPPEPDVFCEICGGNVDLDECICPECPVCGVVGDYICYKKHGLVVSDEQKENKERLIKLEQEQARLEDEYFEMIYKEQKGNE